MTDSVILLTQKRIEKRTKAIEVRDETISNEEKMNEIITKTATQNEHTATQTFNRFFHSKLKSLYIFIWCLSDSVG